MAEEYQDRIMRIAANANRSRGLFNEATQMGKDLPAVFPTNRFLNNRENFISSQGNQATIQGLIQSGKKKQQRWEDVGGPEETGVEAYPVINERWLEPGWVEAGTKWKQNIPLMLRSLRQRDEFKDWSDDELTHYMHRTFSNSGGLMSLV